MHANINKQRGIYSHSKRQCSSKNRQGQTGEEKKHKTLPQFEEQKKTKKNDLK